jgi:hypothetical protein
MILFLLVVAFVLLLEAGRKVQDADESEHEEEVFVRSAHERIRIRGEAFSVSIAPRRAASS